MYLACFGIGNSFCNNLFVGSYVLLRDGFIMLQLCHLGAYLAVAPAAAAAGWLFIYARTVYKDPPVRLTTCICAETHCSFSHSGLVLSSPGCDVFRAIARQGEHPSCKISVAEHLASYTGTCP